MKTQPKEKQTTGTSNKSSQSKKDIKTDLPLSEKDEVKDAERRTNKAQKDHL